MADVCPTLLQVWQVGLGFREEGELLSSRRKDCSVAYAIAVFRLWALFAFTRSLRLEFLNPSSKDRMASLLFSFTKKSLIVVSDVSP